MRNKLIERVARIIDPDAWRIADEGGRAGLEKALDYSLERARAALAAYDTDDRIKGWQPIETAPLDTVILGASHIIGDSWGIWQIRILPQGVVNAWTMEPMDFRGSPPLPFEPTHWMPLPEPPALKGDA